MKTYGGVDVQIRVLLTSALVGGEWSALRPSRFAPLERAPSTHWIGLVVLRTGLDFVGKVKVVSFFKTNIKR
jgi:hypothetical protein